MKRAIWFLIAAAACIIAGGLILAAARHTSAGTGLYCGLGTATTVGCNPSDPVLAKIVSALLMLTAIPCLAAAFSALTSLHIARHTGQKITAEIGSLRKDLASAATDRHVSLTGLLEKHHREQLDRQAVHAAALQAHVSAQVQEHVQAAVQEHFATALTALVSATPADPDPPGRAGP